ncbi:MAG: formate--tetrahydrofolate ligase [Pseudomonadaceae bacterium]
MGVHDALWRRSLARVKPIVEVAAQLGLEPSSLIPYGHDKAKVRPEALPSSKPGTLVLVSAITPTPAGEGKTSTTIGLVDAMASRGHSVCAALREPSLGPCFGIKGGGTGGGEACLVPSADINLHFTGDFHAITSAHNLLAAVVDNHVHFGSDVGLDGRRVRWKRVLDISDRALRNIVSGLGGATFGVPRDSGFDITAASELMAILCLAEDADDLRRRIDAILVGFTRDREPVYASQLGVTGSMMAILRDTLMPNLAQTKYGTPAIVHGGPFANIAHGCNSVIATRTAMTLADWCITEAGFGFDLGGEKFIDIKCRVAGLDPAAVVLVGTARALKMHGGVDVKEIDNPDPAAVERGLPNLARHVDSVRSFGKPVVVAVNRYVSDTEEELAVIEAWCKAQSVPMAVCDHFARGPEGAVGLVDALLEAAATPSKPIEPVYPLDASIPEKIEAIARTIYGADSVTFASSATKTLRQVERLGYGNLPVCMAKTQSSLTDDPSRRGRPEGFSITVRDLEINAGAGFIVALTGQVLRMPGLPRKPQAEAIDLVDGVITGLR